LRLLVGSYSPEAAHGVRLVDLNPDGRLTLLGTVIAGATPSFVAPHPTRPVVYVVDEAGGSVFAHAIGDDHEWSQLGSRVQVGAGPCHLRVDGSGRFLVVSCYGSGDVVLVELHDDGGLGTVVAGQPARAPAGAHSRAHAALVLDGGRLMTTDLGLDRLRVWRRTPDGIALDHEVRLAPGSQPRHLAELPDLTVLVVTEATCEVVVLRRSPGGDYTRVRTAPACAEPQPGTDFAAEIAASSDGRFVYVGIRGRDVISVLDAELRPVGEFATDGTWPRHHALVGGRLVVANEHSGSLACFDLDPEKGAVGALVSRLELAAPTVVCPV
jgi:6-phosphogluconolactonase